MAAISLIAVTVLVITGTAGPFLANEGHSMSWGRKDIEVDQFMLADSKGNERKMFTTSEPIPAARI